MFETEKDSWKSLEVLKEGYQYSNALIPQIESIPYTFKDTDLAETYLSEELKTFVWSTFPVIQTHATSISTILWRMTTPGSRSSGSTEPPNGTSRKSEGRGS
jgi:hypothetical protein